MEEERREKERAAIAIQVRLFFSQFIRFINFIL
jgi:hypothetical protein